MNLGILFAIISAVSFGAYNFFTKLTSEKFDAVLAVVIITGTSFIVSVCVAFGLKFYGYTFEYSKSMFWLPVLAGGMTVVAEIAYLLAFQKGLSLSVGNPLVVGGTTLVAVILGIFILNEQLDITKLIAIIFVLVGLVLLAR